MTHRTGRPEQVRYPACRSVLVAQPEEQEISNLPVAGSIPAGHARGKTILLHPSASPDRPGRDGAKAIQRVRGLGAHRVEHPARRFGALTEVLTDVGVASPGERGAEDLIRLRGVDRRRRREFTGSPPGFRLLLPLPAAGCDRLTLGLACFFDLFEVPSARTPVLACWHGGHATSVDLDLIHATRSRGRQGQQAALLAAHRGWFAGELGRHGASVLAETGADRCCPRSHLPRLFFRGICPGSARGKPQRRESDPPPHPEELTRDQGGPVHHQGAASGGSGRPTASATAAHPGCAEPEHRQQCCGRPLVRPRSAAAATAFVLRSDARPPGR